MTATITRRGRRQDQETVGTEARIGNPCYEERGRIDHPSYGETEPGARAAEGQPAAAGGGRDGRGRFTAGNAGGPGNPFARQTAQLRSALIQRVTIDDINVIADELILRARMGQLEAIKLLFQYVIGKPTVAVNPDTLDVEEFQQVYAPRKEIFETAAEIVQGFPPKVCNTLVRVTNEACEQRLGDILRLPAEEYAQALKDLPAAFAGQGASPSAKPANGAGAEADDGRHRSTNGRAAGAASAANRLSPANGKGRRPPANGQHGDRPDDHAAGNGDTHPAAEQIRLAEEHRENEPGDGRGGTPSTIGGKSPRSRVKAFSDQPSAVSLIADR